MLMKRSFCTMVLFMSVAAAPAEIIVNPWVPIFKGIDHATGQMIPDGVDPRLQAVNALRIDLHDPYVQMFSDPPCTNCFGYETLGLTTSGFLKAYGVQAAVDANFYAPCCSATPGTPMDVIGLSISKGRVVSAQEGPLDSSNVMFTTNKQVIIIGTNWPPAQTNGIYTAVSGHYALVTNGVNVGYLYLGLPDPIHQVQPRAAVGVSQNGRYLYLITIDGRQPGYSDGASDSETADWLIRFGAYNGINLDGGGSTTMVMADCGGNPIQLNVPIDQGIPHHERVIANHLGVFAKPLGGFIDNLVVSPLDTIATISWTTASNATSQVEYGLTPNYGTLSSSNSTLVTNHVVLLNGLMVGSNYFFRAISTVGGAQYTEGCYFSTANFRRVLFDVTKSWKWTTNNLDGMNWPAPNYDDSAWAGPDPGLLYVEDNLAVSPRNTPLPPNNGVPVPGVSVYPTYYFRTHFTMADTAGLLLVTFTNFVDDGAVFYLNGNEIKRLRMPPAPAVITYTTLATSSPGVGDATTNYPDVFSLIGSQLTNVIFGDNVLAAEIHQFGTSDIVFGSALTYTRPTVFTPTLHILLSGSGATAAAKISWDGTGFTLQQASVPAAAWLDVPGSVTNSPYATPISAPPR